MSGFNLINKDLIETCKLYTTTSTLELLFKSFTETPSCNFGMFIGFTLFYELYLLSFGIEFFALPF